MGDTGNTNWESLFYANLAAANVAPTANKYMQGLDVLLPPVSTTLLDGQWIVGNVIGSRYSNSLGLDGGMAVEIGTYGRYAGSGNDPPNSIGAAKFTYFANNVEKEVVICDATYAIKATGNIKATGSISVSGNITAYDGSDRRIKENIKPISNPLAKLSHISGNTFKWKQEYYDKQDKELFKEYDVGVIAQEIEAVLPEAVHERSDGVMAVNYVKIIPLLIEAIKEQQVQIEELRNDIARLSK
jgi:hypothetical protein